MLAGFLFLFASCSNRAHFDEQYKKILYIVNSKEKIHYASLDASEQSSGRISVYCTGSKLPDEDIHVKYVIDEEALKTYNQNEYGDQTALYFTLLPEDYYSFQKNEIVVAAGQEYGTLEFTINTKKFAPDKIYVLPITISDVPEGYEISEDMHTLLYIITINNAFAGDYVSHYKENGAAKGDVKKKAQAMAARQLLFPIAGKSNNLVGKTLNYTSDFYLLTINEDNSLSVNPYLQSIVHPNPDIPSYYDPEEQIFYVHYFIEDQYETYIQVDEIISKI